MNKIFLLGNVGNDPKITAFQDGGKVAQFSLATTERYKKKDSGEVQEETEWHNVVVRKSGLAGVCESYVKKGSQLLITGRLRTRKYTDQSGMERFIVEVLADELTLLGKKQPGTNDDIPF